MWRLRLMHFIFCFLPVRCCVSGGLQVNWGGERGVWWMPELVTNRNVVWVLEGGGERIEEMLKLSVATRTKHTGHCCVY